MPAQLSFFDMEVNLTPPTGHFEPVPLTLGANWQPNDVRMLLISASGASSDVTLMLPMNPDPPTGFTAAYDLNPDLETEGVYYRRLVAGDADAAVDFPKPPGWRHFMWSTITARGVDPAVAPVADRLTVDYTVGNANATVSSVTVPAAGVMVFFLGTVNDPEGNWPGWASAMGVPTGWTHLVATDKSGTNFYQYATDPSLMIIGKSFGGSGSTGSVSVPVAAGSPAFAGMYVFVRPAPDVSVAIGAA